jgi:hypothetical protein
MEYLADHGAVDDGVELGHIDGVLAAFQPRKLSLAVTLQVAHLCCFECQSIQRISCYLNR